MTDPQILNILPHRGNMLLVDQVVDRDDASTWIECQKTFQPDEFFFDGHYPDNPIVPGVILCETAAQSCAALVAGLDGQTTAGVPVLARIKDAKFKKIVRPHDTIHIRANLNDVLKNAFYFSTRISLAGETVATVNLVCMFATDD